MDRVLCVAVVATFSWTAFTGCGAEAPVPNTGDAGAPFDAGDAGDTGSAGDTEDDANTGDGGSDTGENDVDFETPGPEPWHCAPNTPLDEERYTALEDIDDDELHHQLQQMIDDHSDRGYNAAREFMFEILEVRDDGKLECVYTADRVAPDGTNTPGDQFNTEHTWPQSRGADTAPARSDVHHLFPADQVANSVRANYEFGNVDCTESTCDWHREGSFLGPSADDSRDPVFEVRPERRGDVARVILYFSVRYDKAISSAEEAVLRDWHCNDPPDDYERTRNNNIEIFQNNRNPFIDRPDFVDRIDEF